MALGEWNAYEWEFDLKKWSLEDLEELRAIIDKVIQKKQYEKLERIITYEV